MKAPKGSGIAILGLYSVIGLAIFAGVKASKANAKSKERGRMQKDGLFYYYEIAATPDGEAPFAVFASESFAELPPETRDDALAMAILAPLDSAEAGQAFLTEYADALV